MTQRSKHDSLQDVLIVGGGVIGLSLARELAGQGRRVTVVERGCFGREASWAGAGILPAARLHTADPPLNQLAGLSMQMHAEWACELREETGIDTGFRTPGELFVACTAEEVDQLRQWTESWQASAFNPRLLAATELAEFEPAVSGDAVQLGVFLPGSGQVRNPRHLSALVASCQHRGVKLLSGCEVLEFDIRGDRIHAAVAEQGRLVAEQFCLASGAWTGRLGRRLGLNLTVHPIRGQIALLRQPYETFARVINQGLCYLVPRRDGRVLAGATIEDAGFHKQTTAGGIAGLLELAQRLVPSLAGAELEQTWAGLRPATADGLPYLGQLPLIENAFVAAGHFRSGLHLSTGTARVLAQQMSQVATTVPLDAFRVDRH